MQQNATIHESLVSRIRPLKLKLKNPVEIDMDGHLILLNRKHLPIFCNFSWYVEKGKGQTSYLRANVLFDNKKRTIFFHQLVMGNHEGLEIDHINGNGLDNREENLRIVSHMQNQNNQRKRNKKYTSKYIGVHLDSTRRKWVATSTYNRITKTIGRFDSEEEAAIAYNNYLILNNIPKNGNHV